MWQCLEIVFKQVLSGTDFMHPEQRPVALKRMDKRHLLETGGIRKLVLYRPGMYMHVTLSEPSGLLYDSQNPICSP